MNVQVLGPGCRRSSRLEDRTKEALRELGRKERVEMVAEAGEIARAGALSTPALAVDGRVLVSGRVPSVRELKRLLAETAGTEGR